MKNKKQSEWSKFVENWFKIIWLASISLVVLIQMLQWIQKIKNVEIQWKTIKSKKPSNLYHQTIPLIKIDKESVMKNRGKDYNEGKMDLKFIKQWEANKKNLKKYFKNNKQYEYSTYEEIIRLILRICLTGYEWKYDIESWRYGKESGHTLFIASTKNNLIKAVTHNSYGTCSGCDTLLGINEYTVGYPTKEQVNQYMTLSLHLIQRMKKIDFTCEL